MELIRSAEGAGGIFSCSHDQPEAGEPFQSRSVLEQTRRGLNRARVLNRGAGSGFTWCQSQVNLDLDPYGKGLLEALSKSSSSCCPGGIFLSILYFCLISQLEAVAKPGLSFDEHHH